MKLLTSLISNPKEHRQIIKTLGIVFLTIITLFILLHGNDILKVFFITIGALYLFTTEKLPVDLTALSIMVVLMITKLVTPSEGVSGFSSSATITVMAMFVLSAGIQRTGLIDKISRFAFRFAGSSESRQILIIALIVGPISGFINNTAAVAIMLPMVLEMTKRAKTSATKVLIPLSFISMAGGTLTLIGTSTNILASDILLQTGKTEISMFEFFHLGLIILAIVLIYFFIVKKWLLPERKNLETEKDEIESDFLAEILVEKNSYLIGKTLKESRFLEKNDLKLVKIIKEGNSFKKDALDKIIEENDIIAFLTDQKRIIDLDKNEKDGIKLLLDFDESKRRLPMGQIVKLLLRTGNTFHDKSLSQIKFWKKFNAAVVGIHREDFAEKRLSSTKLKTGEILLVKASKTTLNELRKSNDFVIVETLEQEFNREKMWIALAITIGVITTAALGIFSIMTSALAGIILMILTKCLDGDDLYQSVSWEVIFLLAGVIPLGIAMQKSGAADLVADFLVKAGGLCSPIILLIIFYVITTFLTEIISNNASVVLIVPIAISVAEKLSFDPKVFVLTVMFAASTSFLTPIGYQTNTMVYGAGNYKFSDFLKIGAPLNIILAILTPILIVYFWGI